MSFWIWEKSTKCEFSAFENMVVLSKKASRQCYSKVQITGLLFHELTEAFRSGRIKIEDFDTFKDEVNSFVLKYYSKYPFEGEDVIGWKEVEDIFDFLADQPRDMLITKSNTKHYYELEILDTERSLLGKPDLIISDAEEYQIIEFKSGKLFKNELLKEEYVHQLHFYSGLATAKWGKRPSHLLLQSLLDGTKEVRLDVGLQDKILEAASGSLIKFNNLIENETVETLNTLIATPGLDICRFCNLRPICKKFKEIASGLPSDEPVHVVNGLVQGVPGDSNLSFVTLSVQTHVGLVNILNVPIRYTKAFLPGTTVTFVNLKRKNPNTFQFERFSKVDTYE